MARAKNAAAAKYLIDLSGIVRALTSAKNSTRALIIDGIQSGEIIVLRSVSDELKAAYPDVYETFRVLTRTYVTPGIENIVMSTVLMEDYGAGIFGSNPPVEDFEAISVAEDKKLIMLSYGNSLKSYRSINKKCKLISCDPRSVDDLGFP